MIKILTIFGTRPEAIKMAPLVRLLAREPSIESHVCVTGQHRHMLDQVLSFFHIEPNVDLQVMTTNQTLNGLFARIVELTHQLFNEVSPDYVLVHGDTSTAAAASLSAFHLGIPVGHVEAGLRTGDVWQPFPEEANRRMIDIVSTMMFAPTIGAKQCLEQERLTGHIYVTGNTVIDALSYVSNRLDKDPLLSNSIAQRLPFIDCNRRTVLVTGHRRENIGNGFVQICEALRKISEDPQLQIIYPVHLNPRVRNIVLPLLSGLPNVHLIDPLDYLEFVWIMKRASLIITDSGGVQEEAPFLGKPVLVLREVTERPEAVAAGVVTLVGTDVQRIVRTTRLTLESGSCQPKVSPYGDGFASQRIVDALCGREVNQFQFSTNIKN